MISARYPPFSEANITLYDESCLTAADHCRVQAYGNSKLSISSACYASLYDHAELTSFSNSFVRAFDNSTVTLPSANTGFRRYLNRIYAYDQSKVQGGQNQTDVEVMYPKNHSIGDLSAASAPKIIHIESREDLLKIPTSDMYAREIHVHGTRHIVVEDYYDCVFHCFDEVILELCFTNRAVAHDQSKVYGAGQCIVEALDHSIVAASECCHVLARDHSTISVKQDASVIGWNRACVSILPRPRQLPSCCRVYIYDHCTITKNECPETTQVFDMRQPAAISESDCT